MPDDPSNPGSITGLHAFVHDGSTMIDIGTLSGTLSRAFGINNGERVTAAINEAERRGLVVVERGNRRLANAYGLAWLQLYDGTLAEAIDMASRNPTRMASRPGLLRSTRSNASPTCPSGKTSPSSSRVGTDPAHRRSTARLA